MLNMNDTKGQYWSCFFRTIQKLLLGKILAVSVFDLQIDRKQLLLI